MSASAYSRRDQPQPFVYGWNRVRLGGALGLLCALCSPPGFAVDPMTDHQRHVDRAGTILQYTIPAAALVATFVLEPRQQAGDQEPPGHGWTQQLLMGGTPRHDLLLAVGRTWAVTEALKYSVDETRPNGGSQSFPSGHTSFAFAGAEFIRKEYGWAWGAPAYLTAGFVGWSRVEAKKHYTHDVLAGAAIGVLANHDFWRRRTAAGSLSVAPAAVVSGGALVPGLQFELLH